MGFMCILFLFIINLFVEKWHNLGRVLYFTRIWNGALKVNTTGRVQTGDKNIYFAIGMN
jgi:hypothetical protein